MRLDERGADQQAYRQCHRESGLPTSAPTLGTGHVPASKKAPAAHRSLFIKGSRALMTTLEGSEEKEANKIIPQTLETSIPDIQYLLHVSVLCKHATGHLKREWEEGLVQ